MFEDFEPFEVLTQNEPQVVIRGLKSKPPSSASSELPPLLLLHGFPETRHMWWSVAPKLTGKYTVVIPDLRGYGESSKPDAVAEYAKSVMARDFTAVMDGLGFSDDFYICAHDRGARVAHKLAVDFPKRVRKMILLDICPTLAMYESTNQQFASAYYHWFMLIQPEPLPETMIMGDSQSRRWLELNLGGFDGTGPSIFNPECFEHYAEVMRDRAAVHAMCNDYRAGATLDLDEQRADREAGRLIQTPTLVLWGKQGVIEKCFDAVKEWRAVAGEGVSVEGRGVDSGHYIPEHNPQVVVDAVLEFLV